MFNMEIDRKEIGKSAAYLARQDSLKAAEKQGLTIDHVMQRLKESTDATITKEFMHNGEILSGEPMPDNRTRVQAVKLAMQFFESMPDEKLILGGDVNVIPTISTEDRELMLKIISMDKNEFIRKQQAEVRSEIAGNTEID